MNHDENGEVKAQGFGVTEIAVRGETAAMAVAEQAKAAVQARYIVALQRPRDMDDVRTRLLKECKRPGFAAVAKYSVPRGNKRVIGPSIRFAEAAVRCMTNILPESMVVYDNDAQRIVRVTVTDLEANVTYSEDIVIQKTVERKFLKDTDTPISSRTNSSGQTTYLVQATEDDLRNKQAAGVSKAIRGLALRLLPGDILEDAMQLVDVTMRDQHAKDPDADRKKMADAFAGLNINPSDLKAYLGCELSQASPADIMDLRRVYQAIRDGETSWREVVASKVVDAPPQTPAPSNAKDKLRSQAGKKTEEKAPEPAPVGRQPGDESEGNL